MALVNITCKVTKETSIINLNFVMKLICIMYGKSLEPLDRVKLKLSIDIILCSGQYMIL